MVEKKRKSAKSKREAGSAPNPALALAAGVDDAAICIYRNDIIVYASPGMTRLTGYTQKELIGSVIWDLVNPDYRSAVRDHYTAWLNGGELPAVYEFIISSKGGDSSWISLKVGHTEYEGEPAVIGIAYDTTHHRKTMQALLESESKYRNLVEASNDGIVILQDGAVVFANKRAAEMFGYRRSEFLGKPFVEFTYPGEVPRIVDYYTRRLAGESVPRIYETVGRHREGHRVYTEYNVGLTTYQERMATLVQIRDISERKKTDRELRESQEKFRILAETTAASIFIYQRGRFRYVNPSLEKLTGYSREELLDMNFRDIVHPDYRETIISHGLAIEAGSTVSPSHEIMIVGRHGEEIWIDYHVGIIDYEGERAVIGTAYDITGRRQVEAALRENEKKYRQLVEAFSGGIWVIDREARTTYVNPCMAAMLGYSVEEMIGKHLYSFMDEAGIDICMQNLERREQGLKDQHDFEFLRKDGRRIYANFETSQITDESGNKIGTIAGVMDMTDRRRTEEIIMQMAYHDALTGLPNRRLFKDRLKMAMAHANRYKKKVGVLMIDLDRFKAVNDTLGHNIGDMLLKQVSGRLSQLVRTNDTVARLGGDEFMVVLPEMADGRNAGLIAEKIINSMREPFMCDDHKLVITTSIGIALYPSDGRDCERLIRHADVAMYAAKHSGRGAYKFYTKGKKALQ